MTSRVRVQIAGLVFATFLGSCLIIGLLVSALCGSSWVVAFPTNAKNEKAEGRINVGLFGGSKNLNVAYGWRYNRTDTSTLIQEDVIQYIWWLLTTIGVGMGLLCSFVGGVASVIRAASASRKTGTMVILFVSNISSLAGQLTALVAWAVQFYKSLHRNVLLMEDLNSHWSSEGRSFFGMSFFFVLGGMIVAGINVGLLIAAVRVESKHRKRFQQEHGDDKMHGAIMLY